MKFEVGKTYRVGADEEDGFWGLVAGDTFVVDDVDGDGDAYCKIDDRMLEAVEFARFMQLPDDAFVCIATAAELRNGHVELVS